MNNRVEKEGKYYLYRHIRLDSNEPFYIGIGTKKLNRSLTSKGVYSRANTRNKRSVYWKNIVAKTEYKVEILLESDDYEFIKQKEIEFITLYGRRNLGKGTLVNLTDGGEGALNAICSESTKEKKSLKLKGLPVSKETKLKAEEYQQNLIKNIRDEIVGNIYVTNQGATIIVENYEGSKKTHIKFIKTGVERICTLSEVKNGTLKDYFYPSVAGVGYIGGKVTNKKAHISWTTLLDTNKNNYGICKEWLNLQNFTKWFEENYIEGWTLQTNILEAIKTEVSSENSYFIPKEFGSKFLHTQGYQIRKDGKLSAKFLNKHLGYFNSKEEAIERYKEVKKEHILKIADKYKNILPIEVYEKIINYEIQIKK